MINGGHYIRETLLHYTRALLLPAGTGVETRSVQQVRLMRDFGVTVILGFADYIRTLAQTARDEGLEPGRDIPVRLILGHMGRESKTAIGQAWGGAEVYDWYGVGDTGIIAAEGPDRQGLHLFEDAHAVEIVDAGSGKPVTQGDPGNLVTTVLFKDDVYPIIRFDTQDVTRVLPGASPHGWPLRRIEGFLGRSDNMVKLRGINVYPHAIAALLRADEGCTGEYLCRVTRDPSGRDVMRVEIEARRTDAALAAVLNDRLRAALGVGVDVSLVAPGSLAAATGLESRQKAVRLIDERMG
jgi:phenylacetate-CoA ligase